jgi:hypothetical protein
MLIFVMWALLARSGLGLTRVVRKGRLDMLTAVVRMVHGMTRMQGVLLAERVMS